MMITHFWMFSRSTAAPKASPATMPTSQVRNSRLNPMACISPTPRA